MEYRLLHVQEKAWADGDEQGFLHADGTDDEEYESGGEAGEVEGHKFPPRH